MSPLKKLEKRLKVLEQPSRLRDGADPHRVLLERLAEIRNRREGAVPLSQKERAVVIAAMQARVSGYGT